MNAFSTALVCALWFATKGFSQEMETDRPDQTECSSVIPRKALQLETGIVRESQLNTTTLFVPTTLIRLGVCNKAEFRIIAGEYFVTKGKDSIALFSEQGFSPFSFGAKVFLSKEKRFRPQTSVLFHFSHEKNRFSFHTLSYDFRFSMSHTLSKRMDLGYNLGGEWYTDRNSFTWIYTLTTAFSLSDKIGAFIEVFGDIATYKLPDHRFDAGLTFLILKNLQADCSASIALSARPPDRFINAGISWRIPR